MTTFGILNFGLFLAAGILLNLTPGPDTAYILGRGIAQGRDVGVASALGIGVGVSCTLAPRRSGFRPCSQHPPSHSLPSKSLVAHISFFSESKCYSIAESI